jgi:inorganic triphosphatase YgiF
VVDVAKIHTMRERYRISSAKKRGPCLEVDDDHVRASVGERLLAWREIAVDTAAGTGSSAKRLSRRLRAAGAQPARYPSKLARVSPPAPTAVAATAASAALVGYLNAQIDRVVAGDIGLRRGQDPIHHTRGAIRRLRSTLRVFGKLLDQSEIRNMDGELRWFAGLLGEVRDCEVQQARFIEALDGIADNLILGPVKSRIREDLKAVALPARSRVAEAMESPVLLGHHGGVAALARGAARPQEHHHPRAAQASPARPAQSGSAAGRGAQIRRRIGRHAASRARPPSAPATPPNCANRWASRSG